MEHVTLNYMKERRSCVKAHQTDNKLSVRKRIMQKKMPVMLQLQVAQKSKGWFLLKQESNSKHYGAKIIS